MSDSPWSNGNGKRVLQYRVAESVIQAIIIGGLTLYGGYKVLETKMSGLPEQVMQTSRDVAVVANQLKWIDRRVTVNEQDIKALERGADNRR